MAAIAIEAAMVAVIRTDRISWAPSSVVVTIGFVITANVTYSDAAADPVDGAT
jgi:hypothetical protein